MTAVDKAEPPVLSKTQEEEEQQERDRVLFKKLEEIMIVLPRDPALYTTEVRKLIGMFKEQFVKVTENTQKKNERFGELTIFLCRCSAYYSSDMKFISEDLFELLKTYSTILHPYNRRKAFAGIMILRSKNCLFPVATITFLLSSLGIQDKELRKSIYSFVMNDFKRMNKHHKNNTINKQVQQFIFEYLKKNSDKAARKMLNLTIDLYKRHIWDDHKVINIIASGCMNASYKIRLISAYFLISTTLPADEDSDEEEEFEDPHKIKLKKGVQKSTKNREKHVELEKKRALRRLNKKHNANTAKTFFPIDQIYNPQDFSEKLFSVMNKKDEKFVVRLVMMSLVARMIGRHRLIILPFYNFLQKYMRPHQKDIGKILSYFAESVHTLIPEEELSPIIKHLIENFVNDSCSELAMTMGLNTLRELFIKNPNILDDEMMMYLVTYTEFKNKNVATSAKSLLNAVRELNPDILEKKYRNRRSNKEIDEKFIQSLRNQNKVVEGIDGAELLDENAGAMIALDRVLTDDDFRRIRILKKKKALLEEKMALKAQEEEEDFEQEQDQEEKEEEEEDEQDEDISEDSDSEDGSQVGNGEEWETVSNGQQKNEEAESQLDWGDVEEMGSAEDDEEEGDKKKVNNKNKSVKKKIRKQKPKTGNKLDDMIADSEVEDMDDDEQDNPHGFVDENRITYYKKSKGEMKADRKTIKEEKPKFKHTPKEKGGGTNDIEKSKMKPIMMVRPKKNKLKLREKQVKVRIKDLKNKLGKVKSGKQAKQLKLKKVVKK